MRIETPLSDVVAEARGLFSFEAPADHNLCISHRKRVAINAELNELHRPADAIRVEPQHKRPGALTQSMWLWPGIKLLVAATEGEKVRNQVRYEVAELGDTVRFTCGLSLPADKVADLFVLSYAQTYASCQGTEFEGALRLHDTTHKFFTRRRRSLSGQELLLGGCGGIRGKRSTRMTPIRIIYPPHMRVDFWAAE